MLNILKIYALYIFEIFSGALVPVLVRLPAAARAARRAAADAPEVCRLMVRLAVTLGE